MEGRWFGAVYDPPAGGLPYVAIIFKPDGTVYQAHRVATPEVGEDLLAAALQKLRDSYEKR